MIDAYCVDQVTIIADEGRDEWGEPLARTSHPVRGYIEWKTRLVRNIKGEEVAAPSGIFSPVRVYINLRKLDKALGRVLTHEDRVLIGGRERAILAISEPKAFSGSHYEIDLA